MKKLIIIVTVFLSMKQVTAQVGIGTTSPHASSQLEIVSTDKGLLTPRMTATQRSTISSPATGLLVFQTDGNSGFYYYTGSDWINLASGGSGGVPTGTIMAYGGSAAPGGWVLCSGGAISRTTYANLYSIIGTTYGNGDGSSTFNLPDLRGRTIFGKDDMEGTAANRLTTSGGISANNTLGATGGVQTLTLTTTNLPSHTHSFNATTESGGSHTHTYTDAYFAEAGGSSSYGSGIYGSAANTDYDNNFRFRTTGNSYSSSPSSLSTGSSGGHTHTISGTIGTTGDNTAIQTLNPGIVLNYIIKL